MNSIHIGVKRLNSFAKMPVYGTDGAGAFDVYQDDSGSYIAPGESVVMNTGLAFDIPKDHVMLVFSRSGHGFKYDTRLSNCVGVIDSDYTGELKIKMRNDGVEEVFVDHGTAIAQCIVVPRPRVIFKEVEELKQTERGANGFGSTDKHCDKAVEGYQCSRAKDHEGPCAAHLTGSPIMGSLHLK